MTLDENADVIGAQDYYPFGEVLRGLPPAGTNDKYMFTEKERDTETNYDYFGARFYDSELGRWLSVDPLADKYFGWSPFNYTANNPLKYIDPNGMSYEDLEGEGNRVNGRYSSLLDGESQDGDSGGDDDNKNQENSTGNLLYLPSIGLSAFGSAAGIGELSNVTNGFWKGVNGKWYNLNWGGNNWAGSRTKVISKANMFKTLGRLTFGLSALMSVYQGYEAYANQDIGGVAKSGLDVGMGAIGTFGGPIGLGVSVFYFGIDATIGWDNAIKSADSIIQHNQSILGSDWNAFRMEGGAK